jgi:phosphoribosylaminoimidazolecarboxamide formyltransferase/IMP cyclohydrolase
MMAEPAAVIVKHNNPCGAAIADNVRQAFYMARRCDPVSAYGGVVALNREVDGDTAQALTEGFFEVVLAPQFTAEAKQEFAAHSDRLRVLLMPPDCIGIHNVWRSLGGLFLAQQPDQMAPEASSQIVTRRAPTEVEWRDLDFAWRVAAIVKSNAIVVAKKEATLGIGAGQMSRVDSARIACRKAADAGLKLENSVAASDAFFPFADGLDELIEAGVSAVIQPGGSKRDAEVITAADNAGIAMVFTGRRHFRH